MINIIIQKLKEQRNGILYYAIGLVGYAWMIIGLFPTIKNSGLEDVFDKYPKELMKFFGAPDALSITKIEGFLSVEFLSLFFILIVTFYVGSAAAATIASAIEKKTMDFQLSQPISRTKLLLSETFVGLTNTFALVTITSFSIFLLAKGYHVSISSHGLIAFTVLATFFLWSFYGIALIFSSILKTKITVVGATVSLAMTLYVFTSMTNMVEKLAKFEKLSPFYLYNPQHILETGTINWTHIGILIIILLAGIFSSLIIFNKKDI